MLFLERLLDDLFRSWASVFSQDRSSDRAVKLAIGLLLGMGKRTITRSLCFHGEDQEDWSADYKLFSRSPWDEQALFEEIVPQLVESGHLKPGIVAVAWDDTAVPRSGKKIKSAQWMRDAMGPPFHVNLIWGQRFLQGSVLAPLYEEDQKSSPRAIPVSFEEVTAVKKPGKGASAERLATYKEAKKKHNLSVAAVEKFAQMREDFDEGGMEQTTLLHSVDGSYLNRTTLAFEFDRAILVGRARKNARLCYPAPEGGRKVYGDYKFTPERVGRDKRRKWKKERIFHGGEYRDVRYKEVKRVLWQGGGRRRVLRLIVVAPVAYRTTKKGRKYYRQKAYLLCTDHEIEVKVILQKYFDRWQIEYNHRDEKDILGVGEAQVWAKESTARVPAFKVAVYSQMLVTALVHFGAERSDDYLRLPCWRKKRPKRASCQDMVNLLRHEVLHNPDLLPSRLGSLANLKSMTLSAAA